MISQTVRKLDISITDESLSDGGESTNKPQTTDNYHDGIRAAAHSAFDYVLNGKKTASTSAGWPSLVCDIADTVATAQKQQRSVTLSVKIAGTEEIRDLNRDYRQRDSVTNVLSFPAISASEENWTSTLEAIHTEHEAEDEANESLDTAASVLPDLLLGDIVLCSDVIFKEARDQGKPVEAHWSHLTLHGVLHLMGFDHQSDDTADCMESIEIGLLQNLGFQNPYINN